MNFLHPRAFTVAVVWTLVLLYLGSVVHATESSLACPDWPTCFGTMVPEMTGGVFWEHLHRLVAGGLVLMWALAIWLVRKEGVQRPWVFPLAVGGIALLVIQSIFGGLTVLWQLPDLISTTHLTLALLFLCVATVLASATGWASQRGGVDRALAAQLRTGGAACTVLVFGQSVLGGLVRHMDAGMACPDLPLCLGSVVPPLGNSLVLVHYAHRVLGVVATVAVLVFAFRIGAVKAPASIRGWAMGAAALVVLQVGLGLLSVVTTLAVVPVSAHTLVAATLLVALVHLTTVGGIAEGRVEGPAPVFAAMR